jgi:hypothetical protein
VWREHAATGIWEQGNNFILIQTSDTNMIISKLSIVSEKGGGVVINRK